MAWPRDDAKLERVRSLMADEGLDAIVARAPDNVIYLTDFWGMKGWDAVVFPREGEPTLFCLEASAEDAAQAAWTNDVRLVEGYLPADPRPPVARTLGSAASLARERAQVRGSRALTRDAGLRRMVGEPTTYTKGGSTRSPVPWTRHRSSTAHGRSRRSRRSSAYASPTRSRPPRWITSAV